MESGSAVCPSSPEDLVPEAPLVAPEAPPEPELEGPAPEEQTGEVQDLTEETEAAPAENEHEIDQPEAIDTGHLGSANATLANEITSNE